MSAKKVNWDLFLEKIHKEFIAINDADYKKSKEIFDLVLAQVTQNMGQHCKFFKENSKQVLYAGSVYDGIKVSKLDEFDMDIVINLPVNYKNDDIVTESDIDHPGFVRIKIDAFDHVDKLPNWEMCNKVTRDWRDSEKYLLQNKFRSWMHSKVQKALNQMNWRVTVNGETYSLAYKESGPAFTLKLNVKGDLKEFNLDVDLVPVIRLQYPRWPEGYRQLEEHTSVEDWLIVPKPNKDISDPGLKNRYWRLSFQEFERDMMKNSHQLKSTIRLMKKLRDSLQLNIASYYIKTLFLWKIHKNGTLYWKKGLGVLFRVMVKKFYEALDNKVIPYFWQEQKNLLSQMKPKDLEAYAGKLKEVLDAIDRNDVMKVASSLLNVEEMEKFKNSTFFQMQYVSPSTISRTATKLPAPCPEPVPSTSPKDNNQNENSVADLVMPDEVKTLFGTQESSDNNASEDNVKNLLHDLKEKIGDKLYAVLNAKYSFNEGSPNDSKIVLDGKSDVVIEILLDLQNNIDKLANKTYDDNEMKKLIKKIHLLVDKTEEHGEMLKRFEMTDSEYKQKFIELDKTITELTDENEALQREVEEAEVRGERKGTLKAILYSLLMFWVGRDSRAGNNGPHDGICAVQSIADFSTPSYPTRKRDGSPSSEF